MRSPPTIEPAISIDLTARRCIAASADWRACKTVSSSGRAAEGAEFGDAATLVKATAAAATSRLLRFVLAVAFEHVLNVGLRFGIRRNAAILLYGLRSSIVGGDGELRVTVKAVEQAPNISGPRPHVLCRIVRIRNAHVRGRSRFELHQALRSGPGRRGGVEARFVRDDRLDERGIDLPRTRVSVDEALDLCRRYDGRDLRARFLRKRGLRRCAARFHRRSKRVGERRRRLRGGRVDALGDLGDARGHCGKVGGNVHGVHLTLSARACKDASVAAGGLGPSSWRRKSRIAGSAATARRAAESAGSMPASRASLVRPSNASALRSAAASLACAAEATAGIVRLALAQTSIAGYCPACANAEFSSMCPSSSERAASLTGSRSSPSLSTVATSVTEPVRVFPALSVSAAIRPKIDGEIGRAS